MCSRLPYTQINRDNIVCIPVQKLWLTLPASSISAAPITWVAIVTISGQEFHWHGTAGRGFHGHWFGSGSPIRFSENQLSENHFIHLNMPELLLRVA
jgi:hypothetical protein